MAYLTMAEFKQFVAVTIEQDEFDKLLTRASALLDVATNSFYQLNPLEDDFRGTQFKKALAIQIEFMHETKKSSDADIVNNPKPVSESQTVGRTTVNKSYGSSSSQNDQKSTTSELMSDLAIDLLYPTNLLYKGARLRC